MRKFIPMFGLLLCAAAAMAQTNIGAASNAVVTAPDLLRQPSGGPTNPVASHTERAEKIRTSCVNGRRVICGRVIKVLPEGLVVDSGYTSLLQSPYNQSWLVSGGALVTRDAKALELNEPGAACIGPVFLTDYPKRPPVKLYDYVVIQGYPVGKHTYTSVPGVPKTIRGFSAGLDTAIRLNLEAGEK